MSGIGLLIAAWIVAPWQEHPEWGPPPPVAPYSMNDVPSQPVKIQLVFPVIGAARYVNDYNENRQKFHHTGIDIKAPKMSPIVAPFSGWIGMKAMTFWIYGDNGWLTLGTHMNDDNLGQHDHKGGMDVMFAPNIYPTLHVVAGQFLGYVGESGDATAPHLHFEIYAPGPGIIMQRIRNPFASLNAAKHLTVPVPVIVNPADKPAAGQTRLEGCIRKCDPATGSLTLLLLATQDPKGTVQMSTAIRYRTVKLSDAVLQSVGGWKALQELPGSQEVAAYVPSNSGAANKLVIEPR